MSSSDNLVTQSGVPGSPYTPTMAALLRYRRTPYKLILGSRELEGQGRLAAHLLLPRCQWPSPPSAPGVSSPGTVS